jgi:hypothetical protein
MVCQTTEHFSVMARRKLGDNEVAAILFGIPANIGTPYGDGTSDEESHFGDKSEQHNTASIKQNVTSGQQNIPWNFSAPNISTTECESDNPAQVQSHLKKIQAIRPIPIYMAQQGFVEH